MKITSVELFVLKSPGLYRSPEGSEEPPGPTYMGIMKVSTDAGICGYSDMETVPIVAKPPWTHRAGANPEWNASMGWRHCC